MLPKEVSSSMPAAAQEAIANLPLIDAQAIKNWLDGAVVGDYRQIAMLALEGSSEHVLKGNIHIMKLVESKPRFQYEEVDIPFELRETRLEFRRDVNVSGGDFTGILLAEV